MRGSWEDLERLGAGLCEAYGRDWRGLGRDYARLMGGIGEAWVSDLCPICKR